MAHAAVDSIGITANNFYVIDGGDRAIRTVYIQNLTTNGFNLVFFMSNNPSGDRFLLRPGQFKILRENETNFKATGGRWCTKQIRVQPAVAGQAITAFDFDITTWDRGEGAGEF